MLPTVTNLLRTWWGGPHLGELIVATVATVTTISGTTDPATAASTGRSSQPAAAETTPPIPLPSPGSNLHRQPLYRGAIRPFLDNANVYDEHCS